MVTSEAIYKKVNNLHSFLTEFEKNDSSVYPVSSFSGASKSIMINELSKKENEIILLLPDKISLQEYRVELQQIGTENIIEFTDFTSKTVQERLTEISMSKNFILLSTYELLIAKFPKKEKISSNLITITPGIDTSYNLLTEQLNLFEYRKDKFVENPGDFAQRGAIIDFWSYSEKMPVRIEFDGDFIDSIRLFDPENQRSIEIISSITISPKIQSDDNTEDIYLSSIFNYLEKPVFFTEMTVLRSAELSLEEETTLNEVYEEPIDDDKIDKLYDEVFPEAEEDFAGADQSDRQKQSLTDQTIQSLFHTNNTRWIVEQDISDTKEYFQLGLKNPPPVMSNYDILFNLLFEYASKDFHILICTENDLQTNRLRDLLSEYKNELELLIEKKIIEIQTFPVKDGFVSPDDKFLLLTDYQLFQKPYRTKLPSEKKRKKSRKSDLNKIKNGDFVVHEEYGIGRYAGLETIRIGDTQQESMKLHFADGGLVYVNLNFLHLVKKYSAKEGASPKLSILGSNEWTNTKKKAKKKIKELARDLIELYARRKALDGFSFSPDTIWQRELEASFIYEDTPDQGRASKEVKEDMEAGNPMDRLVCGDVGFGKTEIAVRAAFKAVQDGKQVVLLVPTTILAEQHFNTFNDRLSQFPVRIEVLSRFQSKAVQNEIVKDTAGGKVDILIGTHRLLSKDISFKDLGLLIIDEEHRFGVRAKEKLKSFKLNVDTMTMTATPIPRTLNFSLLGARDLSIIATPPPNRMPIFTKVEIFDINKIKSWVEHEMQRGGQIYIVHDRVHSIDKFADYLKKYMPEVKIGIAHGQMKPTELEKVIHGFMNREYDVLLSTKIIESGIDIPNVNTIIINRADRFGLAELHQLRGRVGRSDRQAYAYFLVPTIHALRKQTILRLKAIEEYSDLGVGFSLAMRDLEIRGAGNLLGTAQSGFINDVGFDLYMKMINEAVEELKYDEFKDVFKNLPKHEQRTDPSIDTNFEIGIPSAYMPDQMDRLSFYTSMLGINNLGELEDINDELKDRFGNPPGQVQRLFSMARLKFYASFAQFERVIIQREKIFLILPRGENELFYQTRFPNLLQFVIDNHKKDVIFDQKKTSMKLIIENRFRNPEDIFKYLINFCKQVIELYGIKVAVLEEKMEEQSVK